MAEALVPIQRAQALVRVGEVELQHHVAGVQARPDVHVDETRSFAEFEQRNILRAQREGGEVQLSGGRLGGGKLGVVEDDLGVHSVDVGQLVAGGVDLEIVGIAFQAHHLQRAANHPERPQRRHLGALFDAKSLERPHPGCPTDESLPPRSFSEFLAIRIGRVKPFEIVFGIDHEIAVLSDQVYEQRVGFVERVAKVVVVHADNSAALNQPRRDGVEFLVQPDVIEGEHEIVAGERLAVRPAQAFA